MNGGLKIKVYIYQTKENKPLTDSVINAAQKLLKFQFPHTSGFQNTVIQRDIKILNLLAIQILFIGKISLCLF